MLAIRYQEGEGALYYQYILSTYFIQKEPECRISAIRDCLCNFFEEKNTILFEKIKYQLFLQLDSEIRMENISNHIPISLRYDRDIAANLLHIKSDAEVIEKKTLKKVIMYISKIFQYNLLNEGIFDPVEFCQECNVNFSQLAHKAASPYQLQDAKPEGKQKVDDNGFIENKFFGSRLENILYILSHVCFDINTERTGKGTMETVQILKFVKAFRKGHKNMYYIEISEDFRNNLMHRFLSIDMESYVSMCDIGADELYLELVSLKSALKYNHTTYTSKENTIPFSVLCLLAGINKVSSNGKEYPLKLIKQMLKAKLEAISKMKDMDFDIEWHRNYDSKEPYIVCFRFRNTSGEFNKWAVSSQNRSSMQKVVNEHIIRKMASLYRELHKFNVITSFSEAEFLKWLSDRYANTQEKRNTLERAYMDLGNSHVIPKNMDQIFAEFCYQTANPRIQLISMDLPKALFD